MSEEYDVLPKEGVPDRGPEVFGVTLATLVLATSFVLARIACRVFIVKKITCDDITMIVAWLFAIGLSLTIILGTVNGLGKLDEHIGADQRATLRRCEYAFTVLYNIALALVKTSILVFYLRLANDTQAVLRCSSYFLLFVVNTAAVILTFINIFQCSPISSAWDPFHSGEINCIPILKEFICAAVINVLTDLALLALPLATLSKLQLPRRQKIILIVTFSIGIFVTVIDVVRINELQSAITVANAGDSKAGTTFGAQVGFAWNASLSFMWSAVEVNVGMICACIPTLKPLVLKLLPAMLHGSQKDEMEFTPTRDTPGSINRGVLQPIHEPTLPPTAIYTDRETSEATPQTTPGPYQNGNSIVSGLDFLTTPDLNQHSTSSLSSSTQSNGISYARRMTSSTLDDNPNRGSSHDVYFGFVNMAKPKSLIYMTTPESVKYCSAVTILFFLWGISYGLVSTLNHVVGSINNFSEAQTIGLTTAYFGGGYFFGPLLVGEWILRRDEHHRSRIRLVHNDEEDHIGGFKITIICGLCIYGTGTMIFWPSAVYGSYVGFAVSSFVVGFGLSIVEVASNTFSILCGPQEYGETRLLLCQGTQAIGSLASEILATKILFKAVGNQITLINAQWTYLAVTLLCAALSLFFFYMPLPEVGDEELEDMAKKLPVDVHRKVNGFQLRTWSLALAVFAQYIYTASQESNNLFERNLLKSILPAVVMPGDEHAYGRHALTVDHEAIADKPAGLSLTLTNYLLIGSSTFTISRFLMALVTYLAVKHPKLPKPRTLLAMSVTSSFICALLCVVLRASNPNALVIPIILLYFSEGPVWPLIFSVGLRGQGANTKRAAAFLTMAGAGGGAIPFIMYGMVTNGVSPRLSYLVIVVLQVLIMSYPLFLILSQDAKNMVDPKRQPQTQTPPTQGHGSGLFSDEETATADVIAAITRPDGTTERTGRLFRSISSGLKAKLGDYRRGSSAVGESHHDENKRTSWRS